MNIPKHHQIRLPALQLLAKNDFLRLKEFEKPLAKEFSLSDDEIGQMYASGNGPMFYDRISWALSYLNMSELVLKPKWGTYQISDMGKTMLNSTPNEINDYIDKQIKKKTPETQINEQTPEEGLYGAFESIRASIYTDIIDTILSKSPRAFEALVVKLLQSMGYGGEIEGIVTPYSNDGGIDGIIKEDVLGLGRIHIQAKRYARDNKIGREEIQKFIGALAGVQSGKGIFITTSSYKKTAIDYVDNLNSNTTLVLIDGLQLAKYIYEYSLGMQVEQTIEIKKMDGDFWDLIEDDDKN
jgi:restriction system protein